MFDITVYQFSRAWGLPNASPFCMKLEGYLKLGQLPYKIVEQNDPRKGPKSKIPYVKIDKQIMGDSEQIYEFLHSHHAIDLDAPLTDEQRAVQHAMRSMCEESLYFVMLYSRWMDDANWDQVRDTMFAGIPKLIRPVITNQIRKKIQGDLVGQGMGRHNTAEVYSIGAKHVNALGQYLGDKTWFGEQQPVKLDVVAVSYLANILKPPIETPLKATVKKWPNLVSFTERALTEIFGT
ncbi:glutathione S-transferase family protein [Ketobacter sp.]|uniref:glutathione S-transferase family protein n=1 Tax=Ketobacter sp. TaxID=2083498 RepID=UPI000F1A9A84|nr:glutathione S-transferase family protein [Ketobacter sp.]RLT96340.1 MAG: glutathione S-transferase family protein [Ketobacter sp.]